jgi:predicted MFS family arabinose efflux permease
MVSGPVALLTAQNWRLAWWAFALAAAGVTVWTTFVIPTSTRNGNARDAQLKPRQRAASWPAGAPRLLAAAGILGIASSAVWTFGRDLVVTTGGAGPLASTLMWIVLGAAGLAGASTGTLINRVGLPPAWIAAMLTLAAATAGLALGATLYPVMFAAAAVFGAVYIALTGLLLVWGTRVYPDRPALGVGAAFLLIAVGQAIGAPLLGLITDLVTATGAFYVAAATAAVGAAVHPTHARTRPNGGGSDGTSGPARRSRRS